jgi:hypothetical protein
MKKAEGYQWAKFPELCSVYVEVRERMWKFVVDRLDDKMDWRVIEKTVIPLFLSLASVIVTLTILQDHGSWIQDCHDRKSRVSKTARTRNQQRLHQLLSLHFGRRESSSLSGS